VEPNTTLTFDRYQPVGTNWVVYKSEYPMSNSVEMDQISDKVATMGLPEVFYGNNHIYFINPKRNLLFEMSAIDAVRLSSFADREALMRPQGVSKFAAKLGGDENALNMIDLIPTKLEVQQTDFWKKRDTSTIKDFKTVEVISDWTFTSPYKGSVKFLSNHVKEIQDATSLDLTPLVGDLDPEAEIRVELTDEQIPYERLSP
jgi:hypothetical protein